MMDVGSTPTYSTINNSLTLKGFQSQLDWLYLMVTKLKE
jgi:hypothetical protein